MQPPERSGFLLENTGGYMQVSCADTLVFSFLSNENKVTKCCCSPAIARFGLCSQEYKAKEGRTGCVRTSSFILWLCHRLTEGVCL